jgi:L-aspartate oxidase
MSAYSSKHIVIVGSGIAGLIAALELSRKHAVTLVTKAQLEESNTRWAQGGIAAAMFSDDSVAAHIADTLRAGAGLCNPAAVEVLCTEGPARIRDLIRLGVAFDMHNGELARGLEAAHSSARVLHAGGDSTGLSIETALVRAVRNSGVRILDHTFACDLVLDEGVVTGIEVIDASNTRRTLAADAVILASGGAGQLFLHTTNPSVATGDGVAMALRAGAELADLEFYQFHPTALATPGTFLISEAVRGEGALLLDANRRRFMQHIHPDAELAPRDVVARGIARQMAAQGGKPVLLDITAKSAEFLAQRFPTIDAACRARGLDWSSEPIPVTPAAHYWMGGVRTDLFGRTSVPGLFAIGEAACTGVHGANRLASNSLLESLVFAWRCAHLLLDSSSETASKEMHETALKGTGTVLKGTGFSPSIQASRRDGALAPEGREAFTREDLQTLLWTHAGIERTASGLQAAAAQLSRWQAQGTTVYDLETANLLDLARVLVAAALAREESRGAHFREDFPDSSIDLHIASEALATV